MDVKNVVKVACTAIFTKEIIKELRKINPEVDDNIFRSLHNVNMATIPGWRDSDSGEKHLFLEKY